MIARQLVLAFRRLAWPASAPAHPRVRARQAARRAVLWGLAAAAVAHLGFAVALETALPEVRHPEHGKRLAAVRELRRQRPDRPLVLVLGSSRTQNAVSPAAMGLSDGPGEPVAFNYGQVGTLPAHLPVIDRRLLDCGVRADALVVEIFPAMLANEDACESVFGELGSAMTAVELARLAPVTSGTVARDRWLKSRLNPWHTFRQTVQHEALDGWVTDHDRNAYRAATYCDQYGFTPYGYTPFGPTRVTGEERLRKLDRVRQDHVGLVAYLRVSDLAVRSYRELVRGCRARGVPVAFFVTPESPTFRSWYTPDSHAALAAFYRLLSAELGAPVFDASGGWAEEDFADGHHMLPHGAERFSRRLADDHLRPWLARE